MSKSADLVVVGGGIAGLTTALASTERGLRVVVIDEPTPGAASRAAAGMLAPSVEGLAPGVRELALEARDYYPRFLAELRAKADIDVGVALNRKGILEVAMTDDDFVRLRTRDHSDAQTVETFDRIALARLEPSLSRHAGALLHATDGAVDNITLMTSLDIAVTRDRGIRRIQGRVESIGRSGARHVAWTADGTRHESAAIVIANGAWAAGMRGLPRALPVRPLRGQLLLLDRPAVRHVVYVAGGYLVPRGASLLVGATAEDAGFLNVVTADGLAELRGIAQRAIAHLASARVVEHWAGLRPITPDALPLLGADPDEPGLFYACGFSRNGILLAPWAATQLATLIAGGGTPESLLPFSPARFASG